jgi:hypothetical protein
MCGKQENKDLFDQHAVAYLLGDRFATGCL